jgi:hypothetical protein
MRAVPPTARRSPSRARPTCRPDPRVACPRVWSARAKPRPSPPHLPSRARPACPTPGFCACPPGHAHAAPRTRTQGAPHCRTSAARRGGAMATQRADTGRLARATRHAYATPAPRHTRRTAPHPHHTRTHTLTPLHQAAQVLDAFVAARAPPTTDHAAQQHMSGIAARRLSRALGRRPNRA